MIVTEFYNGQGLGNQLWCYFVTRCIAYENKYEFGIQSNYKFKGQEFLEIDFGNEVIGGDGPEGGPPNTLPNTIQNYYKELIIRHSNGLDISKLDDNLLNIKDNTKIDGNMQSINYIFKYKNIIKNWIKIKSEKNILDFSDQNICIIHIRGGDFHASTSILYKDYYDNAIKEMSLINPNMIFYIVTDDYNFSKSLFPEIEIIGASKTGQQDKFKANHHIGGPIWMDWTILLNAKNAIISASSFSFWPIWLNDNVNVIAPMYWADYKNSDGYWSCGDSLIPNWQYLNRNGKLYTFDECLQLKLKYENNLNIY